MIAGGFSGSGGGLAVGRSLLVDKTDLFDSSLLFDVTDLLLSAGAAIDFDGDRRVRLFAMLFADELNDDALLLELTVEPVDRFDLAELRLEFRLEEL